MNTTTGGAHDKFFLIGFTIILTCLVGFVVFRYFHGVPNEPRWYEAKGYYQYRLTLEEWNSRVQGWTPDQVQQSFGVHREEGKGESETDMYRTYIVPVRSAGGAMKPADLRVWFVSHSPGAPYHVFSIVENTPAR